MQEYFQNMKERIVLRKFFILKGVAIGTLLSIIGMKLNAIVITRESYFLTISEFAIFGGGLAMLSNTCINHIFFYAAGGAIIGTIKEVYTTIFQHHGVSASSLESLKSIYTWMLAGGCGGWALHRTDKDS